MRTFPTIRIGNDIDVLWKVYSRNGEKFILDDKTLTLWLVSGPLKKEIEDFEILNRNGVSFHIDSQYLHRYGIYKMVLSILDPDAEDEDATIDITEVFQVVSRLYVSTNDNVLDGNVTITPATVLNNIVSDIHEGTSVAPDEEDITIDDDLLRFKNREAGNGLGYFIVRRDSSFADQVTEEDTIYEIRYDFDLGGDSVTIPSGCVLKFNGGSLNNGTVVFDRTAIEGPARILCNVSGSLTGEADIAWFGAKKSDATFDNGPIINKVSALSQYLKLGTGYFYFKTPIVLQSPKTVDFKAFLKYTGTTEDVSLVTVNGSTYGSIYITEVDVDYSAVDYSAGDNSNYVGVDLKNCICCEVNVGQISGPNIGLRLFGDGQGCCYNTVSVGRVQYFNQGVRFYQDNGGWCNENTLYGTRLTRISSFDTSNNYEHTPILMAGSGAASDTYDKINSISINECCAEQFGAKPAIIMRNAEYVNVNRIRCEGTNYVAKFVGACQFNSFLDAGFEYNGTTLRSNQFDLTESTRNPFTGSSIMMFNPSRDHVEFSTVGKDLGSSKYATADGFTAYELTTSDPPEEVTKYRVSGNCVIGLKFNALVKNDRFVTISSTVNGRVFFLPLEATIDGQTVTDFDTLKQYVPLPSGTISFSEFKSGNNSYGIMRSGADGSGGSFYIPQPITKFFVGFSTISNCTIDFLVNRYYRSYQTIVARSGSTRPTDSLGINDAGFMFFDTTAGNPIYWTGTGWVDATGASV